MVDLSLNEAQKKVLTSFKNGEFAHLKEMNADTALEYVRNRSGNLLLYFVLNELEESAQDPKEGIRRLVEAGNELHHIAYSLAHE